MGTKTKKTLLAMGAYVAIKWTVLLTFGGYLYKSGHWNNRYLAALPVIGLTVYFVRAKYWS